MDSKKPHRQQQRIKHDSKSLFISNAREGNCGDEYSVIKVAIQGDWVDLSPTFESYINGTFMSDV